MPGSTAIRSRGMPLALGPVDSSRQEIVNLGDDIIIAGVELHRGRSSLHVHEDDACTRLGGDASHFRVGRQRGDVVDDDGPGLDCLPGDLGLRGIDREGNEPLWS